MSQELRVVQTKRETKAPTALRPRPIERVCPIDLRPLAPVPSATAAEVAQAVARSRVAQDNWRRLAFADRAAAMKRAAKALLARRFEAIDLVRDEMGKLEIEGLFNESLGPIDFLNGWIGVVKAQGQRETISLNPLAFPGKSAHIDLVPRGVIGVIAPWNFPIAGLYRALFPALLTGNGVVVKPSEFTPLSSQWLADVLASELPDGLIQVVQGDGAVGQALLGAGIDACVFTGSPRAGHAVSLRCAELGIPSSLEMGGKDAAIVLADCELDRTLAGVTHWALSNVGQSCGALEIAYVEAHIADEFVARLGQTWPKLRMGPEDYADIGPIANRRQFDIVRAHVADAVAKGATLVCGGQPTGKGLFFQPTVLDHCTDAMDVVREETFGPVLAVVRVEGAADAIRRINRAKYGLGASIWTTDYARAERLAERLDVGVVDVNNHSFTGAIAPLPWSGTRESGFGVANSHHALGTYVRPRALDIDRNTAPEPFWMPFDRTLWQMGQALSEAQLFDVRNAWKLPFLMQKRVATIRKFFGK